MDHMIWLGAGLISRDRTNTVEAVVKKINAVTLQDVQRVAKEILAPQSLNVSLVGPLDDKLQAKLRSIAGVA